MADQSSDAYPEVPNPDVTSFVPKTAEDVFEDFERDVTGRVEAGGIPPKQARAVRRTLRRLRTSKEFAKLKVQLDTQAEVESLRADLELYVTDEVLDAEEGKFTRDTVNDLREVFDYVHRKETVENHLNSDAVDLGKIAEFEGIETVDDLSKLSVEQLVGLEYQYEGILLYAFSDFTGRRQQIDFSDFETFYRTPEAGTKIHINFRGNKGAEQRLGAADILPPAVRRITVYEDGDKRRARTSVHRAGLKGRNGDNEGFYDADGYMPIFTGDVVVVGGDKRTKKDTGIDLEKFGFDKYRKADGTLDYEAYAAAPPQEETDALDYISKLTRSAQRGREMTTEELDAIMEGIEGSGIGAKVARLATKLAGSPLVRGKHCWDWVNKIYKKAGARHRRVYQDLNYSGKDCGMHRAPEWMLDKLQPGDWLYINNKNRFDRHGNHSVIFLGWDSSRGGRKAKLASCPRSGSPGRVHYDDLNQKPVTHISKPT